ncbi:pleckstrin homology domain-containing family G member 3 [Periophthalmus magnuspinnatus]|uniref:pleckstrin homology domain-containing family G member 3 n=1 Tax=Periophthalmus magnuspinnatus TaxID=409849 RepID=UPI00145BB5AC|nr:pleckstrin homology domain-containing family G member 3 [Periophthalmus magnuspinnatus]XP_055086976.1 pleckstrin homology domain-containing family G member 3 [Periophthalmus magnuspinnatus]
MPEGSQSALHQGPMGEESPQLSASLPHTEHDPPHTDPDCYTRICMDPLEGESKRPVSLVSTLSSGSSRDSHSLFGSTVALPSSATPPIPSEDDIDLELSPAHCNGQHTTEPEGNDHWKDVNQWNNNNAKRKSNGNMRHFQPPPVITDAMAPNPKLTYVDRVVMEIIETERMYVKDLRSIVEDYLAHIIDTNNLPIRPEQVCALFGNIEDIYVFNSELLQSLDMCQRDPVAVAQCFVDKSESFEIYTQYCNNYPNSVAALTDCMRCKNLAKFFKDRQATLKRSLPLGSYLLKPVQRILKYHLLLQEIAKHFDPDEEGCEVVQEAIETMTGVAWYINDMKRKHEHAVRVQEIQSLLINWKGADLTTYGELVLEGTFHVLRAKNTRTLFLFEKMLLITKKRGENYVYKTHISCSTLMLLDSAKDPLLFSVIHFKHPKQPHTVQAKSIEEKNLWSHNIKRLILENHSTIVPPKAKEAMMDNANYPGKYNYSPERLKKSSDQTEDLHLATRTGRRRSEPAKQIFRSAKAVLKHADSEGALLGDRCPLQPTSYVRTLGCTLDEPQAHRPNVEDFITSREHLSTPECDERPGCPTDGAQDCDKPKEADEDEDEEGDNYKEDSLMGGDQVADFASSVLAAISCWQSRSRAMLSTHFSMDDKDTANLQETPLGETEPQRLGDKHGATAGTDVHTTQVTVEDLRSLDFVSPKNSNHHHEVPYCHTPESLQTSTPELHNTSQETAEEEEEGGSDSSSFHVEETNVLTNGEMSEEEPEMVAHSKHMLNQASVMAQHYINNISRQSSLISDDLGSVACSSPLTDNEPLTSSSVCLDREKDSQVFSSSPEPILSSHQPALNDFNKEERRSTLSKQDRLLIHKIRTYYEHAEDQDVNFSIKRRESLSYIPAGMVRQLSRQIDSAPLDQATPPHRKELSRNRPTSWSVFDLPGLDKNQNTETTLTSISNDVFKPSSEMLKLWEETDIKEEESEAQYTVQQSEDLLLQTPHNVSLEGPEEDISEPHTLVHSPTPSISSPSVLEHAEPDSELDEDHFSPQHLPKSISFRTSMEEDQILQDMGKMKNKVFQLARQYSQRIKNNKPVKWQKSQETGNQPGLRSMLAVQEERTQFRKNGKPNLRLALNVATQAVIHEVRSPSPVQTPSSGLSSHSTLVSPQTPQSENFHWPDVQELRSKYTQDTEANSSKVSQSSTLAHVPLDSTLNRSKKDSPKYSSSSDLHKALADCPRSKSVPVHQGGRFGMEDWPLPKGNSVLCRWSSLDHMLGSHPLHEVQNLQRPVRGLHTTSQLCLASKDSESHLHDGLDSGAALSSGKMTESNIVKSLREKFLSLSTSS